jgi:hypothetical protein
VSTYVDPHRFRALVDGDAQNLRPDGERLHVERDRVQAIERVIAVAHPYGPEAGAHVGGS